MIRQLVILPLFLLLFTLGVQAQDPVFSQFYAAPAQLNPALTGTTLAPRIALNYRNQWPGLNAYVTYAASVGQFVEPLNSGFGLMVMSDDQGQGLIQTNNVKALYSYRVMVNRDFSIRFGVEAGFQQARYDWDRFIFLDQIDKIDGPIDPSGNLNPTAEERPESNTVSYFDMGAGIVAYSKHFYAGLTVKHLTRPEDGLIQANGELTDGLPMLYSLHAGTEIIFREARRGRPATFISPNLLILRQAQMGQVNVGAYGGLGMFFAGTWYRHAFGNPDALIFMAGTRFGIFKLGYSYDVTVSELATAPSGGAHEISLIMNFELSESFQAQRRANRYNDCFQLFR
jgi:type IX secretion system PorP/SprF family membrane protein